MQQIIKKHLTLLLVLLASMATFTSCDDDEGYAIDVRDLPSQAWDFLDYYYYDIPVVEAFYYGSGSDGYYRVNLADGTGIGFDAWAMVLRIRPLGLKRPGRHNPAAHNQFCRILLSLRSHCQYYHHRIRI